MTVVSLKGRLGSSQTVTNRKTKAPVNLKCMFLFPFSSMYFLFTATRDSLPYNKCLGDFVEVR